MQDARMINNNRNALAELLAGHGHAGGDAERRG